MKRRRKNRQQNVATSQQLEQPIAEKFALETASRQERFRGWRSDNLDADGAGIDRKLARERIREQVLNNSWVRKAVKTLAGNVVGIGIKPRFRVIGRAKKKRLLANCTQLWNDWAESLNASTAGNQTFYSLQVAIMQALMESGEVLIRRYYGPNNELRLHPLEADYLDEDTLGNISEDVADGIQYHLDGPDFARPRNYLIRKYHPGDTRHHVISPESSWIPASEILHIYSPDRIGQRRGYPWLTSGAVALRELLRFRDATVRKAVISAIIAGFTRGQSPNTPLFEANRTHETRCLLYTSPSPRDS